MFRYEKDMIPVIRDFFLRRFPEGYFIKEFHSGIGIADFVFSPEIQKRDYYFNSFELLFHTLHLFDRINKKVTEEELLTKFSSSRIEELTEKFIALQLIEEIDNKSYIVKSKLIPSVVEFYSIEAKINNWKGGYYQALRYKNFSHKSYLAIASDFIHRVDKDLLISTNIGLISVSPDETKVIINPQKRSPNDEIAYYYSGENFVKKIHLENIRETYSQNQWI